MWLFLLGCLTVLVALPRFNRRDLGPWPPASTDAVILLGDAPRYIGMVEDFRGEPRTFPGRPPRSPFTYRPLVPLVASLLPFDAMTSINIVSLAALLIALICIYASLFRLGFDFPWCVAGCLMFIFSLPAYYYSTCGYTDAALVSCLAAGVLLILTNRWTYLALLIFLGAFVKETIMLLIPPLAIYLLFRRTLFTKEGMILPVAVALFAAGYLLARRTIPGQPVFLWIPTMEYLTENLSRVSSWKSYAVAPGVQGVLAVFIFRCTKTGWFRERLPEMAMFITGCLMSLALAGYAVVSAFADGRYFWTSYPFSIPLAAVVLAEWWERRRKQPVA